uniref:Uncharacterized protein n=1 Tax=Caenorhabditis japonica TaxID=281687 RepID=A0A8R1ETK2_CAEJA
MYTPCTHHHHHIIPQESENLITRGVRQGDPHLSESFFSLSGERLQHLKGNDYDQSPGMRFIEQNHTHTGCSPMTSFWLSSNPGRQVE